jgi:rubredoxin
MRMLISSPLSPTATISRCPQCAATMRIKLIEPDLTDPRKTRHVFECPECGLPRTYFNYLRKAPHSRDRRGGWYRGSRSS